MERVRRRMRLVPALVWGAGSVALLMLWSNPASGLRIEGIDPQPPGVRVMLEPEAGEAGAAWDVFSRAGTNRWSLVCTELVSTGVASVIVYEEAGAGARWYAAANAAADQDADGLSDGREVLMYGSDPGDADSDGDGLADGASGVVPVGALPNGVDGDGDGFADGELAAWSSPTDADSDDDGTGDGAEWSRRTDPLNPDTTAPTIALHVPSSPVWLIP